MAKSIGFCSSSISIPIPYSSNARRHPNFFKSRCSYFDYPLASKIIVKNVPLSTSESSLQKEFSKFGLIAEVKLVKDEATKKSKGFAFIQYASQEDAMLALETMDHKYFDGRVLYVELAKPRKKDFGGYPKTSGPPQRKSGTAIRDWIQEQMRTKNTRGLLYSREESDDDEYYYGFSSEQE